MRASARYGWTFAWVLLLGPQATSAQPRPEPSDRGPQAQPVPGPEPSSPSAPADLPQSAPVAAPSESVTAPAADSATPSGTDADPPGSGRNAAMAVWATAGFAEMLGPGQCVAGKIHGAEPAIALASTLKQSVGADGLGIAAGGTLSSHPLVAHLVDHHLELLAGLLVESGYAGLGVGLADLMGPLLTHPGLAHKLAERGLPIVASNLDCPASAVWCEGMMTAGDPLVIIDKGGYRYAFISLLPDDTLSRVEPANGVQVRLRPAAQTLVERTRQARAAGVDLVIASIDHGPDETAALEVAGLVAKLPPEGRPDLFLSPSAGEHLLFLRPPAVSPGVVGTPAGALMSVRVTRLAEANDLDVLARRVALRKVSASLATLFDNVAQGYCRSHGAALNGGTLETELTALGLVSLGMNAARQMALADVAIVDPMAFDQGFAQPSRSRLQRGQVERAVAFDSRLVAAEVGLDWLSKLPSLLAGPRALQIAGISIRDGNPQIAGRDPVVGASYRVVTTAVLARSGRLPAGAQFEPMPEPSATLRGVLLAHLDASSGDPRTAFRDPAERVEWILRSEGELKGNLSAIDNPDDYDEAALQVDESRAVGAQLTVNLDADAPAFLFENIAQLMFARDYATDTTAQDLASAQTTYTYRGLWDEPRFYHPNPFVEGYAETEFERGDRDYHHLLLRPEAGLRFLLSSVLSFKASAGFEVEAFMPDAEIYPGLGAELVMKPWTAGTPTTGIQMQGNVSYLWIAPADLDQHTLHAQLTTAAQIVGPLSLTLTASYLIRKDGGGAVAMGFGGQAGLKLTLIERWLGD
jgi:hypothetical protein